MEGGGKGFRICEGRVCKAVTGDVDDDLRGRQRLIELLSSILPPPVTHPILAMILQVGTTRSASWLTDCSILVTDDSYDCR